MGHMGAMARTETVATRTLPEEKRVLAQIARQERRTMSETLREMIRDEGERRGLWPPAQRGEPVEVR